MVEVVATDEFRDWYLKLSDVEADAVTVSVERLELFGVALAYPHSSEVKGSSSTGRASPGQRRSGGATWTSWRIRDDDSQVERSET